MSTGCSCGWRRANPTAIRCGPGRCASDTPTRWSCRGAGPSTTGGSPSPGCSAPHPTPSRRTGPAPAARPSEPAHPPEQLALETLGSAVGDRVRTVAQVTGEPLADEDPDATVAIPWMPNFDEQDDLDGVLAAQSPLLARAFRGTDRRR